MNKSIFLFAIVGMSLGMPSFAQTITTPQASTPQFIRQNFGLSTIELSYSRPDMHGRKIFGDLVPFGKVWRTGANLATTLTFGDPVSIGGTVIPAGKYGLLTIPGSDEWTVIITHQLDVTSPAAYKPDQDVVQVKVPPVKLPFPLETFTILFADVSGSACNLQLIWETTVVNIPITTDIDSRIMTQIDNTLNKDSRPYYQAAYYYLENGKDLNKALEWFDKAIAQDPTSYFALYQKARCLAKLGKKQEAIAAAKQSGELAEKANNPDYVTNNQRLIASLQ